MNQTRNRRLIIARFQHQNFVILEILFYKVQLLMLLKGNTTTAAEATINKTKFNRHQIRKISFTSHKLKVFQVLEIIFNLIRKMFLKIKFIKICIITHTQGNEDNSQTIKVSITVKARGKLNIISFRIDNSDKTWV